MPEHFGDWLGRELTQGARFQSEIERLRRDDSRDRRATPRFSEYRSVEEMDSAVAAQQPDRNHAWSQTRRERTGIYNDPERSLAHLAAHASRLRRDAALFLGASSLANELLHYLREDGVIPIMGAMASQTWAAVGAGASSITAGIHGDIRWSRETSRRAWSRYVSAARAADDGTVYYFDRGFSFSETIDGEET